MPSFPGSLSLHDDELELRRLLPTDREAILVACQDPEILRWTTLPDPFTSDSALAVLDDAARAWYDGTVAELALVVDGRMVGATHLAFYSDWRASVAYWLAADPVTFSVGRGAFPPSNDFRDPPQPTRVSKPEIARAHSKSQYGVKTRALKAVPLPSFSTLSVVVTAPTEYNHLVSIVW
jgi:hypothetical protein